MTCTTSVRQVAHVLCRGARYSCAEIYHDPNVTLVGDRRSRFNPVTDCEPASVLITRERLNDERTVCSLGISGLSCKLSQISNSNEIFSLCLVCRRAEPS